MPVTDLPIAYAGEPGAFAEDAVLEAFGDVPRSPFPSFRSVFEAVTAGDAAAGVVPIENVINGTVRENYDLLVEFDLEIRGEVMVPVRLCLAALPGQHLDEISRVYSHIQALGQAESFLRSRPWQLLSTYNTAGAGKAIADSGERGAAAVLSPRAAALFGLEPLADDVGDLPGNRTRFLVLARPAATPPALVAPPAHRRTTLVVAVRNEPGTLLAVLRVIAAHGLNMRKLESTQSGARLGVRLLDRS
jgi:prephenate dehydratase